MNDQPCPLCKAPLTLFTDCETENHIWRKNVGKGIPFVEVVRRPCKALLCSLCEFGVEVQ